MGNDPIYADSASESHPRLEELRHVAQFGLSAHKWPMGHLWKTRKERVGSA
jgi:hypothetical protein